MNPRENVPSAPLSSPFLRCSCPRLLYYRTSAYNASTRLLAPPTPNLYSSSIVEYLQFYPLYYTVYSTFLLP